VHTHRVRHPTVGAVRDSRADLHELDEGLREPRPLYARGVAIVRELLTDGAGPLYTQDDATTLSTTLPNARAALTT
jgi:hypothetical protein